MENVLNPFQFVVIVLAGWMNQRQQNVIAYLREENRVLREQLGDRRLWFNDNQRSRLVAHAERFVGSIKESYLERLILFGEHSLRRAIR